MFSRIRSEPHFAFVATALMVAMPLVSNTHSADSERSAPTLNPAMRALEFERRHDAASRSRELAAAIESSPDSNAARWAAGYFEVHGKWITVPEFAAINASDPAYSDIVAQKHAAGRNALQHHRLAIQFRRVGLDDEARFEALTAVFLAPEAPVLQIAVGRKLHGNRWYTDAEWAKSNEQSTALHRDLKAWQPQMLRLRKQIVAADKSRKDTGDWTTIERITDTHAIPALEVVLTTSGESCSRFVVACMNAMPVLSATCSLVRHAVWSPYEAVRADAVEALRSRDPNHVIPMLIDLLRPAETQSIWQSGNFQQPINRWFWQDYSITYCDTLYCPVYFNVPSQSARVRRTSASIAGNPQTTITPVPSSLKSIPFGGIPDSEKSVLANAQRDQRIRERFATAEQNNEARIENAGRALASVTGFDLGREQPNWLAWWAKNNDEYFENETPSNWNPDRDFQETTTGSPVPERIRISVGSCFAATTPVWTKSGLKAIDRVELGEGVLSLNETTGELAFRPVLRRTALRRATFLKMDVESDCLRLTRSHPVWSAGKGWQRSDRLSVTDFVRTSDSIVPIRAIGDGGEGLAYNLEVADFATFFVGKARVLVHDYSPIREAPRPCPGAPAFASK